MKLHKKDRVFFYSKEDMSWGHNLKKAEVLLESVDLEGRLTNNDLLEIYSIKLYFDNELFHPDWNDSKRECYKETVKNAEPLIQRLFLSINDTNIIDNIESLEFDYKKVFWKLFDYYQVYKRIGKEVFKNFLDQFPFYVTYIITNKNTVKHFGEEIKTFLLSYNKTAELMLSNFEQKHQHNSSTYHFPNCLSLADKEEVISKYITSDTANLNYVRLIEKSNSNELNLSPKVKLKAKKKADELNDKVLEEGYSWMVGIEVTLDKDLDEPAKFLNEDNILKVFYSEKILNEQKDDVALFHLFSSLFSFTDSRGLTTLVSKQSELDTLETIFITAKNEYITGLTFQKKGHLSNIQIALLDHYLKERNNSIERLVSNFVNQYLNSILGIKGIKINLPSQDSTYLEKIRVLAPEFEFLLKQFQSYVVDGEIDFELLEFNSNPLGFGEVKSLTANKYIYEKNGAIQNLKHYFFSDQCLLYYIEPYKDKYDNLHDLLTKENVSVDYFKNYQQDIINYLIKDGYLYVNENGFVKINKEIMVFLIGELEKNEVINYWFYPDSVRNEIDKMIDDGMLIFEGNLFTKQEVNYLNYYLNKKEFTNGFDLRNKYLHGTNSASEIVHKHDYYILLKLVILTLIKIEHDIVIHRSFT